MSKLWLLLTLILIFHFAGILVFPPKVSAQTAGLSITPPTVEILLSPSKKVIQSFTVKNQGETGLFTATLQGFTPIGFDGHVTVDPNPLDTSSLPLIVTTESGSYSLGQSFELGAGETVQVVLGIEGVATDVAEDIYLALVVKSTDTTTTASNKPGIAALVLATLAPTSVMPIDLSLENFDPPALHDPTFPFKLFPILKNNAPLMIRPLGKLEIISPRGTTLQTAPLYPNLILRDSSRALLGDCHRGDEPPTPCPLELTPHWYNLGPHTLRATITTQGGTVLQQVERTIWFIPLRLLAIILVIILLLTSAGIFLKRRVKEPTNP